ncbi:MAG: glycosyltransferase family 4 protein [Pyrinomonadaceae bacterium]|nr:glycosyltransferase family 4 protein [Pyrinomonadaceae bacterium]
MIGLIIFIVVFITSLIGVEIFRRWSLQREIFDIPNERSSHRIPTPRGGGVIIVLTVLSGYTILSLLEMVEFNRWFFIASLLISSISWLDDLFTISFVWRFIVHSISALLIVLNVGYFQNIEIPYIGAISGNFFGGVLTFLWIVWMTNAYNFMDGIDGIAGIQATIAGIGWYFVGNLLGMANTSTFFLIVSAACLGFLVHNWQPAKIFMGDVGSAFLGFCFAAAPFLQNNANPGIKAALPFIAVSLVWLFYFDTVFTFTKRLIKKQKVWVAHREHFYQQLIIQRFSHRFVATLYGIFALLNLLVVYLLVLFEKFDAVYILISLSLQSVAIYLFVMNMNKVLESKGAGK